jgi:hypothetical protein
MKEKLCSDPNCEYCGRMKERGRKKCLDCGKSHRQGIRCKECSHKHYKMIYRMRHKKSNPVCIDCGHLHSKGLRCQPCSLKHSTREWVKTNPERYDFMSKMRYKKRMRICPHCDKPFFTNCGRSIKKELKCPFCGFIMQAKDAKKIIISRRELREIWNEKKNHHNNSHGVPRFCGSPSTSDNSPKQTDRTV